MDKKVMREEQQQRKRVGDKKGGRLKKRGEKKDKSLDIYGINTQKVYQKNSQKRKR